MTAPPTTPHNPTPPHPTPHQSRKVTDLSSLCVAALAAQAYALKEENDSLRWQLDAYRNEVELLKQEKEQLFRTEETVTKDQQLQFLQQTMQGMQQVPGPDFVLFGLRERDVCVKWKKNGSHLPGKVKEKKGQLDTESQGKESASGCWSRMWRNSKAKELC